MKRSESPEGSEASEGYEVSEGSEFSDTVKTEVNDWSSNTSEALEISLYTGEKNIAQFHPLYTDVIFGEEEAVFGYKGLEISLSFDSHNLKPHIEISWEEQWERGEIKASDVQGALEEYLPASAFRKEEEEGSELASSFSPPGTRLYSYGIGDANFEIWCTSMENQSAKDLMEYAQIFVPLFIDGGTQIQLDQDWAANRWKLFLLYQVHKKTPDACPYSLIGFSTSYRLSTIPDNRNQFASPMSLALLQSAEGGTDAFLDSWVNNSATTVKSPLDLPSRERISQFLILPPYQNTGHGPQLYNTMFQHLVAPKNVLELTVEDPNEPFDDMRDMFDMIYLRQNNNDFASLAINTNMDASKMKPNADIPVDDIVDGAARHRIKQASKIMPRQLVRLLEMQTLSKIPQNHRSTTRISRKEKSSNEMDRAYFYWRLFVKSRLYDANRQTLGDMDREERIDKLEATVNAVQDDYIRLLALTDKREKQASDIVPQNPDRKNRKRKLIVEDDEDEDDSVMGADSDNTMDDDEGDYGQGPEGEANTTKKRRLAVR